jgi:hypothetical protein
VTWNSMVTLPPPNSLKSPSLISNLFVAAFQ